MQKMTRTTRKRYEEMLEILPPEAYTHGRTRDGETFSCFLVGEPVSHRADGSAVFQSYYTHNDEHYTGELMTADELYSAANAPDSLAEAFANANDPDDNSEDARIIEAIDEHHEDIVEAFAKCFGWDYVTADAITEAYSGCYGSDEDFARDMAEQFGSLKDDDKWPYTCIDWERAARELMFDYCEDNGYYFLNV